MASQSSHRPDMPGVVGTDQAMGYMELKRHLLRQGYSKQQLDACLSKRQLAELAGIESGSPSPASPRPANHTLTHKVDSCVGSTAELQAVADASTSRRGCEERVAAAPEDGPCGVDYAQDAQCILESSTGGKLFLGPQPASRNLPWLQSNRISWILCCAQEVPPPDFVPSSELSYCQLPLKDVTRQSLFLRQAPRAIQFIHSALSSGGNVLVHCVNGRNRSATIVLGYILEHSSELMDSLTSEGGLALYDKDFSPDNGKPKLQPLLNAIKSRKRPVINPSLLFIQTLNRLQTGQIAFDYQLSDQLLMMPACGDPGPPNELRRVVTLDTPEMPPLLQAGLD